MASSARRGLSRRRFLGMIGMAGLAAALPVGLAAPARASARQALLFSDVHWDPYRWPKAARELVRAPWQDWHSILTQLGQMDLNTYGQETSYGLLEYSLDAMRAACPEPEFILFSGDLPTHKLWKHFSLFSPNGQRGLESFVANFVAFTGARIRTRFPQAPIFFTLGNNDAFCGDYQITPGGGYLSVNADTFLSTYLNRAPDSDGFGTPFPSLGCYSLPLTTCSDARVISMNSTPLSANFACRCCQRPFDPGVILDWLETELRAAEQRGERVCLLTHIPFGINAHTTAKHSGQDGLGKVYLHMVPALSARLQTILARYAGTVDVVINGHIHMDAFKVLCAADGRPLLPALITPALNALRGGNPAFKVLSLASQGFAAQDYATFRLDLAAPETGYQREYRFSEAYGVEPDAEGLAALHQAMAGQDALWRHYRDWYNAGQTQNPLIQAGQDQIYWLAQRWHDKDSFLAAWQNQARAWRARAA